MLFLPPGYPPLPATRVPYAQATAHQLALVLNSVVEELGPFFPDLYFPSWSQALAEEKPDLWEEKAGIFLHEDDLARLTQRLATFPELPPRPVVYPDQACYLARKIVRFQDLALWALQEIEAAPHAFGYAVFNLVLDLAAGDGTAQQVYRVTHRQRPPRPGDPDPEAVRWAAPARVEAIRRARAELNHPARKLAVAAPGPAAGQ